MAEFSVDDILRAMSQGQDDTIDQLESSQFAKTIMSSLDALVKKQKIKDSGALSEKDAKLLASIMSNEIKNLGIFKKGSTEKLLRDIKKSIEDAIIAGSQVSTQGAALYGTSRLYSAVAGARGGAKGGQLDLTAPSASGKVVLGQAKNYLSKDDFNDTMNNVTNKLLSFLKGNSKDSDTDNQKFWKKQSNVLITGLLDGLMRHKLIGGAIQDGSKLFGYIVASHLSKIFGPFGRILGLGVMALTITIPALLTSILHAVLQFKVFDMLSGGSLSKGIGSSKWSRYASRYGMGATIGKMGQSFIRGVGGFLGRALPIVGYTAGGLDIASGIGQIAQAKDGVGAAQGVLKGAGGVSTIAGAALIGKGAQGTAVGAILIALGRILDYTSKNSDIIKEFTQHGFIAGLKAFWKSVKDSLTGKRATVQSRTGHLTDPRSLINVPLRGNKYIEGATEAKYPFENPLKIAPTDDTGKIKASPFAEGIGQAFSYAYGNPIQIQRQLSANRAPKEVQVLSKTKHRVGGYGHLTPWGKIDIVGVPKSAEGVVQQIASKHYGKGAAANYEGDHFDISTAHPTVKGYQRFRATPSTIAGVRSTYGVKPRISKEGWFLNPHEVETTAGSKYLWEEYQRNKAMQERYEWIPANAKNFQNDVYYNGKAMVPKGTSKILKDLRKQGYKAELSSGIGLMGRLSSNSLSYAPETPKAKSDAEKQVEQIQEAPKEAAKKIFEFGSTINKNVNRAGSMGLKTMALPSDSATGNRTFSAVYNNLVAQATLGTEGMRGIV